MRQPSLSIKIYNELKQDIELKKIIPGSQIPPEPELAAKYKVARNTMRKVLSRLEEEELLIRKIGKGTFVREEPELPIVYFLIPQADYMTQKSAGSAILREYLHGAMLAVSECNCRIETLVFSPDNNNEHIDLKLFSRLNANSLVIIPSVWFFPAFKLLQEIGCKVALIHNQSFHVYEYESEIENWIKLIHDRRNGLAAATLKLAESCSKIALASPYLLEKMHPVYGGYCQGLSKINQPPCAYDLPREENYHHDIKKFYEKEKFDGLIVDISILPTTFTEKSINEFLEIPESVKVIMLNYLDGSYNFGKFYGALNFSGLQTGYDAVRFLIANRANTTKTYEPSLTIN